MHIDETAMFCTLQEVQNLAKYVVRKFFEVAAKNDKVFVELFFLKSVKDAVEITEGYGTTRPKWVVFFFIFLCMCAVLTV